MSHDMVKRRLYKPERRPARRKGVLERQAPIACPDANRTEIAMALATLCRMSGVVVGQGGTYDALKDEYTVIGKVLDGSKDTAGIPTGKAQDVTVKGLEVARLIKLVRRMNGGKLEHNRAAY